MSASVSSIRGAMKVRSKRMVWLVVACLIGALAGSLLVAVPPAQADEASESNPGISGLEVAITDLRPLNPQPKKHLTVAGTVVNRTESPINTIVVNVRLGQSPVTSVQAVVDLDSNTSIASTRQLPGGQATQQLGDRGGLAPQAATTFSFRIPFKDIAMPGSGIYALQVQAVDFDNSGNSGYTQTFLPWYPKDGTYQPINVLMYWPLATIPNKTSTNLLMNDLTPTSVDVDGRLHRILGIEGAKEAASWIVDPSLIQTLAATATGYDFLDGENQPVKGDRAGAAANWLSRAKQTLQGAQVQAMPYANSDTTALVANDLRADAAQSIRTAAPTLATDLGFKVDQTLTWVPTGQISDSAFNLADRAGSQLAVLSRDAVGAGFEFGRPRNPVVSIPTSREPAPALIADPDLSRAFTQAALTPTEEIRLRQRILALIGAWPASQEPTSVVVAPPTLWSPNPNVLRQVLAALRSAKWASVSNQAAILKAHEQRAESSLVEPTLRSTSARGTRSYFRGIAAAQRSLQPFESVLGNPLEFTNPAQSALLRAESRAWQGNRRGGRALLSAINDQISQGTAKVRAVASEVVSVSSDSGSIPMTLINDFDQPATIKVRLDATPSVRLESEQTAEYEIPARRKISVEVPIKVAGSEDLPVAVQLLTPDGQTWGVPEEVSVRSSAYARAATWVVVAAFVLLVGLLTMNSVRRRKAAKAEAAAGGGAGAAAASAAEGDSEPTEPTEPTEDANSQPTDGTVHQLDHWRDPRD